MRFVDPFLLDDQGDGARDAHSRRESVDTVLRYHAETKHDFHRYARSLGSLDWANQPNPFRLYDGLTRVKLPLTTQDPAASYLDLYERTRSPCRRFSVESLSLFLELSLGLSAWKSISDSQWALRMNPSSGNLHPTEGYVVLLQGSGAEPSVCHYSPLLHALELRAHLPRELCEDLKLLFPAGGFLFLLTSIFWREAWKYGERAFRYCNHDVGHAIASARFAANLLGWKMTYLHGVSDEDIARILGLRATQWIQCEEEHPDILCYVHPGEAKDIPASLPSELVSRMSQLRFQGEPNRLSGEHVEWEIISEVAMATRKPGLTGPQTPLPDRPLYDGEQSRLEAPQIIRQRRSAVAFDGATGISKSQFLTMLDKTLPRDRCAPFDINLGPARVHLLLFVHRVQGVSPGLYMFVRDEGSFERIKAACHSEFLWNRSHETLPLYLLSTGSRVREATAVSCHQEIAGDSAFSLGMVADFRQSVEQAPFLYRHLFWETGIVGQVLYLEAEAHGVRATGIGCFFDDPVHHLMGLKDDEFQTLYHFTIGGPVEDTRLQTWPAYSHLNIQH
ncbi:MAG: SagB/ThcOx family dehydrogenase [Pirellulaceae bacterium]